MAGKKRIAYLDLTKLWAIFLVCMGHAFTMLSVGYQAQVFGMLYTFHMALFMLMCGYFSHHALSMPFGPFVKKKALQLLVPTAVYVGLNLLATWVVTGNCPTGFIRDEAIGGMWFKVAGDVVAEDYWEHCLCAALPAWIFPAVQLYDYLLLVGLCDEGT